MPKLTSRQLAEWQIVFGENPFGQDITNYMLAELQALLKNRWRAKGSETVKASDLMPRFSKPKQTPEEMKWALRRFINK